MDSLGARASRPQSRRALQQCHVSFARQRGRSRTRLPLAGRIRVSFAPPAVAVAAYHDGLVSLASLFVRRSWLAPLDSITNMSASPSL